MQTTAVDQAAPNSLSFHHHLMAMGLVAWANPLIYYHHSPIRAWLGTLLPPLMLALGAYGLYALLLSKRARNASPKSFLILGWALLIPLVANPWINPPPSNPYAPQAQRPAQVPALPSLLTELDDSEW